jgi:hypothetical protein
MQITDHSEQYLRHKIQMAHATWWFPGLLLVRWLCCPNVCFFHAAGWHDHSAIFKNRKPGHTPGNVKLLLPPPAKLEVLPFWNRVQSWGWGYLPLRRERSLKVSNGEKTYLQIKFFSDQFHKSDASAGLQALKHFLNGERLLEFGAPFGARYAR